MIHAIFNLSKIIKTPICLEVCLVLLVTACGSEIYVPSGSMLPTNTGVPQHTEPAPSLAHTITIQPSEVVQTERPVTPAWTDVPAFSASPTHEIVVDRAFIPTVIQYPHIDPEDAFAAFLFANDDIVIVNQWGQPLRKISPESEKYFDKLFGINWSSDGCTLQISAQVGEALRVIELDHLGAVTADHKVAKNDQDIAGGSRMRPVLSPSGEWISYSIWSGERYYQGAEYQNLGVISTMPPNNTYILTERGGLWLEGASWSPDGSYLVFTDYDSNGIVQIYRAKPDGTENIQLSAFTDINYLPGPIKWAPNGALIAANLFRDDASQSRTSDLWLIDIDGVKQWKALLDQDEKIITDWFFWGRNSDELLVNVVNGERESKLKWISASNGEVLNQVNSSEVNHGGFYLLHPLDGIHHLGFVGAEGYLQYIPETGSLELWARWDSMQSDPNVDVVDFSTIPDDAPLSEACSMDR